MQEDNGMVLVATKVNEFEEKVKALKEMLSTKQEKVEVVIAGNVKAGKSTLINAIFKDETLCQTGVVRTTTENQLIESELYRVMDTPGINANDEDTLVAKEGYEQSDFFIFAHNIVEGELLAQELDFLKELQGYFNDDEQFARNIVIVLTNADQLTDENKELAQAKINEQLALITQASLQIITVDSISYLTALAENKSLLMEHSNIPKLQSYLEEVAKRFNANLNTERAQMDNVKKSELIKEMTGYEEELKQQLESAQSSTIDTNTITELLAEVKSFPNKVEALLQPENIKSKQSFNTHVYLDISSSLRSSYTYSSSSSAKSAGVGVVRDKILSKAERAYVQKRRELIDNYRALFPNFVGDESAVTQVQYEIEGALTELKKKLVPLVTTFTINEIASSNTTLTVNLQDVSDEPAFKQPSSLYSDPYESDYDVESASWYDSWIDTDYRIEYKRGLFGEKEIKKYNYDANSAKYEVQKHVQSSIKSVISTLDYAFSHVYCGYKSDIQSQVEKIIEIWSKALQKHSKSGAEIKKQQEAQLATLKAELTKVETLKQAVQAM